MRTVDRIFGWLLAAGSVLLLVVLHRTFRDDSFPLALGQFLAVALLASMNLMRAERPHDRTLARVCVAGNLCLAVLMAATALASPLPALPIALGVIALLLAALSARTRRRSRPM